jgi:hypothetical protein
MIFNRISWVLLFTFGIGITTTKAQTTKSKEVTSLIKKKRAYNKQQGHGYRIQLDNGFEITVKKTKSLFKIEHPDVRTYILYKSPEWKVQVGDYRTKLEADKALNGFKKKFPSAIVVPR